MTDIMDWLRDRKPEKSDLEKRYESANRAYEKEFGERYPYVWGDTDMEAAIKEMHRCIGSGKKKESVTYDTSGGKVY